MEYGGEILKPWSFGTYFKSCVEQKKMWGGGTAQLNWISDELCRELREAKPGKCCKEGKATARNALPQCPVSAQWEMLSPNEWARATAPQIPKPQKDGRGCHSVTGKKQCTLGSLQHSSPQKKMRKELSPSCSLSFSKDTVKPRLGFLFCIHSPDKCILWHVELGCFTISWRRKSPSTCFYYSEKN